MCFLFCLNTYAYVCTIYSYSNVLFLFTHGMFQCMFTYGNIVYLLYEYIWFKLHTYIYATLHYMILNYITFNQITYIETYNTMQCNALEHKTIQFTYVHTLHTYIPT